jgi:phytoene dehydrogenase-like protein
MAASHDIIIIGGGHNGLITAFYLARAGLKPLLLERRSVVGGAAVTAEFHPGFRCSSLAHVGGPLAPEITADMQLERHGLKMINPDPRVLALSPDGPPLLFYEDPGTTAQEISGISAHDAERYPEFHRVLTRLAPVINRVLRMTPPSVENPATGELWSLFQTFRKVRGLGEKDMYRLLRWAPMAVADLVGEWFESDPLRATIAARGIFGTFCGPWSAGTGTVFMLRAAADPHPAGTAAFPHGGMGALTQALATAAIQAGAQIRTGAAVASIVAKDSLVTGVALEGGEEITANTIISNADPRRTLLSLLGPLHLQPNLVVRLQSYLSRGTTAKVNLALAGLPTFSTPQQEAIGGAALTGRIHIGPGIDYLERAFDAAKYGRFSEQPYLDISIPSLSDPSLAPEGNHVMSVYMQFAPYQLREGDWATERDALGDTVVNTLAQYAPDLPGLILARQVITPPDLESTYGLTGGLAPRSRASTSAARGRIPATASPVSPGPTRSAKS